MLDLALIDLCMNPCGDRFTAVNNSQCTDKNRGIMRREQEHFPQDYFGESAA